MSYLLLKIKKIFVSAPEKIVNFESGIALSIVKLKIKKNRGTNISPPPIPPIFVNPDVKSINKRDIISLVLVNSMSLCLQSFFIQK